MLRHACQENHVERNNYLIHIFFSATTSWKVYALHLTPIEPGSLELPRTRGIGVNNGVNCEFGPANCWSKRSPRHRRLPNQSQFGIVTVVGTDFEQERRPFMTIAYGNRILIILIKPLNLAWQPFATLNVKNINPRNILVLVLVCGITTRIYKKVAVFVKDHAAPGPHTTNPAAAHSSLPRARFRIKF